MANMKAAIARALRDAGTRSAIQLVATGAHTASPIPTPKRVASSIAYPDAAPESAVSPPQSATPPASKRRRLPESASRPSGSPATANTTVNQVTSAPTWVSVSPNSRRTGSTIAPSASRS